MPETFSLPATTARIVAGGGLLVMAAVAGAATVTIQGLVTTGEATSTAHDLAESATQWRLAVLGLYLVAALDLLVAWALLHVLRPVHAAWSQLGAWLRMAYAAVFVAAIAQLVDAPEHGATALDDYDRYTAMWDAGLLLFGLHLVVVGALVWRSAFLPRWLGVLVVVAGLGYLADTVVATLSAGEPTRIAAVTFVGEFLLAIWLRLRRNR